MVKLPDISSLSLQEKFQLFDLLQKELHPYVDECESALSLYNLRVTYANVLCLAADRHEALEIFEDNIQSLCKDFLINEVSLAELVDSRYDVLADNKLFAEEIKDDLKTLWELEASGLRNREKLQTYFDQIKSAYLKKLLQQHIDQL